MWMIVTAGFTSWEGHLGGLLTGGATAVGLSYAPRKRRGIFQAAVIATTAGVVVGLALLKTFQLTGSV